MSNSNSPNPIPRDYAQVIQQNIQKLNTRRGFDFKSILSEEDDFLLLETLEQMEEIGTSGEATLSAMMAEVGCLSNDSFIRNVHNDKTIWLNQLHHGLGESGSNKSAVVDCLSYALNQVKNKFPGVYSARSSSTEESNENTSDQNGDDYGGDNPNGNKKKKEKKKEYWSMVLSTVTEASLLKNMKHTDTMIIHPDGDAAVKQLGYYEQGLISTSPGVSAFLAAADGINAGFSRSTGVEVLEFQRTSKLSMFIVSTGAKLSFVLQKFIEEKGNDGVCGRVLFHIIPPVDILPSCQILRPVSVPNLTHLAFGCHYFFQHPNFRIEFRYQYFQSDIESKTPKPIRAQLKKALQDQGVKKPEYKGFEVDALDMITEPNILGLTSNEEVDELRKMSAFAKAAYYSNLVWKEGKGEEYHIKQMWRKFSCHLPKAICTLKIIRVIFRIIQGEGANGLLRYLESDEGSNYGESRPINEQFLQHLKEAIDQWLSVNGRVVKQGKQGEKDLLVIPIKPEDVDAGHVWIKWKLETTKILFSSAYLPTAVNLRLGKPTSLFTDKKTDAERRMDDAMLKVMMSPVIFFSSNYMHDNFFPQKNKGCLKSSEVVVQLVNHDLIKGCNAIIGARNKSKVEGLSRSYYKRPPAEFEMNASLMAKLLSIGADFNRYKQSFFAWSLPPNSNLSDDGVKILSENRWVPYYHSFQEYSAARFMIETRLELKQIFEWDGRYGVEEKDRAELDNPMSQHNSPPNTEIPVQHVQLSAGRRSSQPNGEGEKQQGASSILDDFQDTFRPAITVVNNTNDVHYVPPTSSSIQITSRNMIPNSAMPIESASFTADDVPIPDKSRLPYIDIANGSLISSPTINQEDGRNEKNQLPTSPRPQSEMDTEDVAFLQDSRPSVGGEAILNASSLSNVEMHPFSFVATQGDNNSNSSVSMSVSPAILHHSSNDTNIPPLTSPASSLSSSIALENVSGTPLVIGSIDESSNIHGEEMEVSDFGMETNGSQTNASLETTVRNEQVHSISSDVNELKIKGHKRIPLDAEGIQAVVKNKRHSIWRKLIVSTPIIFTCSDMSRFMKNEEFDARYACLDELVHDGILLHDKFLSNCQAFLKASPENTRVQLTLADYGIDVVEYRHSFNDGIRFELDDQDHPNPAIIKSLPGKSKATRILIDLLTTDEFYKMYIRLDAKLIEQAETRAFRVTTSSNSVDRVRTEQQLKAKVKNINAKKRALELEKENAVHYSHGDQSSDTNTRMVKKAKTAHH